MDYVACISCGKRFASLRPDRTCDACNTRTVADLGSSDRRSIAEALAAPPAKSRWLHEALKGILFLSVLIIAAALWALNDTPHLPASEATFALQDDMEACRAAHVIGGGGGYVILEIRNDHGALSAS